MSVGIASVDSVLARMAQIQVQIAAAAGVKPTAAATATATATATSDDASFASALADAGATTDPSALSALSAGTSDANSLAALTASAGVAGSSTLTASTSTGVTGDDVVADVEKYLGIPYVWGGTTTAGLDCSGLVQKTYGDFGITLPRTAAEQAKVGTAVDGLANAKPGDILAFGSPAHHVAIYVGNDMMIAAPQTGENVKIQKVYETPSTIRRIVGTGTDVGTLESSQSAALTGKSLSAGVSRFATTFAANEAKYHLPSGLLAAVAQTESGGNVSAVSPVGAQGLMQLMPGTARGLGVDPWVPAQAIGGAAKLLSGYLDKYGSVPLALAAYNAGPGAVEQYGGVPPYTETQNYVKKITGLMAGGTS